MKRRILIIIGIIIVAIAGGYFSWNYWQSRPVSHKFAGQITEISKDKTQITLNGTYFIDSTGKADTADRADVKVLFNSDTKFVATAYQRPSPEELKKNNGAWDMTKVKIQTIQGSLNNLFTGMPVVVKTSKNVLGDNQITAQEINYVTITD
ncbi:MAG: hypothetical protein V1709_09275 [Planctomycetota bacterium]